MLPHLKRVLLWLSLTGILSGSASAWADDRLLPYEQIFFGDHYAAEPLPNRLSRLEQSVFGEVRAGTDAERQTRLLNALKSLPLLSGDVAKTSGQTAATGMKPNRDATDYPTVTVLEQTLFNRDYAQEDISVRLSRLEKRVLGADSPKMALVDRVDRLLARYPAAKESRIPSLQQTEPEEIPLAVAHGRDIYAKVEALERRFFSQASNTKLMLPQRLDQLEEHAYGKTFEGESAHKRVNRLMAQYTAAKGSEQLKPLNHRLASKPPQVIYDSGQNVQVGAGQIQFSQDLLNMLPNDVRSQLQSPSGGGITASTPSTVIIRQESSTTQYPGFQTYGGAPIQYYNYYGSPTTSTESQTTTTVIQPNGSTVVYGYNTLPSTLPNPAFVGDPAFLRQLDSVEANVFGRVHHEQPVYTRLNKLEMAVLLKTQPYLPDYERLNAVFRAWKIRKIGQGVGSGQK